MVIGKIKIVKGETLSCVYLYEDGHIVAIIESVHPQYGRLHRAVAVEQAYPGLGRPGRVIVHSGGLGLLESIFRADGRLEIYPANVEHGSANSKKLGLRVESINWRIKGLWVSINSFPDICSAELKYQAEVRETWGDIVGEYTWSTHPLEKVTIAA